MKIGVFSFPRLIPNLNNSKIRAFYIEFVMMKETVCFKVFLFNKQLPCCLILSQNFTNKPLLTNCQCKCLLVCTISVIILQKTQKMSNSFSGQRLLSRVFLEVLLYQPKCSGELYNF